MKSVSVCHLAYYWGSKVDAFRVCVCVRIVSCLSRVCAGHSAGFWSSRAGTCRSAAQVRPPSQAAPTPPSRRLLRREQLPAVDVVQETPVQKAARAKKQAVAVSPPQQRRRWRRQVPASQGAAGQTAPTTAPIAAPITVPSAVTNVTDTDIEHEGTGSIQQTLQQQVPGIIISDAAGNPLRAELSYRGFDASPVSGRAQGLAVYQNGVRINEAFGDVVNWDVIPSNAISSMSVVSNNPVVRLERTGRRRQHPDEGRFQLPGWRGRRHGRLVRTHARSACRPADRAATPAIFVAGEWFEDDGFRDFSDSEVRRFYGDIGLKGSFAEVHFSLTAADNHFGATAAAPVELLERSWSNTFTSPQTTDLEVYMPTISASVKATDTLTFSGVGYYRRFKNRVVDGNVTEIEELRIHGDTVHRRC